jgi:hypothetical protein
VSISQYAFLAIQLTSVTLAAHIKEQKREDKDEKCKGEEVNPCGQGPIGRRDITASLFSAPGSGTEVFVASFVGQYLIAAFGTAVVKQGFFAGKTTGGASD